MNHTPKDRKSEEVLKTRQQRSQVPLDHFELVRRFHEEGHAGRLKGEITNKVFWMGVFMRDNPTKEKPNATGAFFVARKYWAKALGTYPSSVSMAIKRILEEGLWRQESTGGGSTGNSNVYSNQFPDAPLVPRPKREVQSIRATRNLSQHQRIRSTRSKNPIGSDAIRCINK